jgi:hypothetical protein
MHEVGKKKDRAIAPLCNQAVLHARGESLQRWKLARWLDGHDACVLEPECRASTGHDNAFGRIRVRRKPFPFAQQEESVLNFLHYHSGVDVETEVLPPSIALHNIEVEDTMQDQHQRKNSERTL